jgi:SAM-dependent methyltransferase
MWGLGFLAGLIISAFCLVVLFGPPYLPTLRRQKLAALDLLDLKPGQTMLDIGSGDGRVLREAAKRGYNVVGIELNLFLVLVSRLVTWRYRHQVRVIWGSYWRREWPQADGVFVFALPRLMLKIDRHVRAWHAKPVRLVSFAFAIPGKPVVKQRDGVFLYEYK